VSVTEKTTLPSLPRAAKVICPPSGVCDNALSNKFWIAC